MSSSESGGVKVITLGRRMMYERERLIGMTDEERAWRAQYLKDQILSPDEPCIPENYYKKLRNPIRRFYRAPMDKVEAMLTGIMSAEAASVTRYSISAISMAIVGAYCTWYYFKYNKRDWSHAHGWKVSSSREIVYPNDPNFPNYDKRVEGKQFNILGFDKSPI